MANTMIADRITLERRYLRAVDMARDLTDPAALDGYVVTPSVRDALVRVLSGVGPESTQRAFRVTGPYGSGKSSFGLLLARIFAETQPKNPARLILKAAVGDVLVPNYLPIILVGRRTSLADELLRALGAVSQSDTGYDEDHAARAMELLAARAEGDRDVRPVLDLLASYGRSLAQRTGCGLLLLVDEMGRYLEFAAANPAREDPSIFQLLAERAGGATPDFAIVGFLHHRFGDYVAGLGAWMEGEWARSSERYEEIAFQESTEQTLHLMAEAVRPSKAHSAAVREAANALYSAAAERKLFAGGRAVLGKVSERLYPLHPAALACLASSARRFGQNERSVFSFLQSLEPAGFQRFIHEHSYGDESWYRLHDLYEYLSAQGSFRFRSADRERRWQLALDAVALCADMPRTQLSVLKALSVLAVLEPVPGLRSDAETIAWCLGIDKEQVAGALAELVARGVAHARSVQGDYSLWSHSSVDLDGWFQDARVAAPQLSRLDEQLSALPPSRPQVAHRHYHRTGTLRTFGCVIGDGAPGRGSDDDGTLIVLPVHPDEDPMTAAKRAARVSAEAGPLTLVRTRRITAADLAQTHELACWQWIRTNCRELRIDDIARAEVDKRIAALERDLMRVFAPFTEPTRDVVGESWFYNGAPVQIESRAELSRLLTHICDTVFCDAPVLRNELINRDKLSTAIAAARMRLLELMLTRSSEAYLGLDGAPPERTIYLSLFHASRLHDGEQDAFEFGPPPDQDPNNWMPTWKRIDELVRTGHAIRFDELIAELGKPPIGLRAGPALPVIAAYMLHNRSSVALMERGTFQPELTPAHFMRLAKTPSNFALRHVSIDAAPAVLEALSAGISVLREQPAAELKAFVEALYRWWQTLPDYARTTRLIDARAQAVRSVLRKAREPVELIFESLPQACGVLCDGDLDAAKYATSLDIALTQIGDAFPALQQRASAALLDAFGARSLAKLRHQVQTDYEDYLLDLGDRSLRAFVDRAINAELSEMTWLDGVASLVVGRRLDSWGDETLDEFSFEVRSMAQRLARRLAQIRESKALSSPVTAVHLLTPDGAERSIYVRARPQGPGGVSDELRKLIANADDPDSLLLQLLAERITALAPEKVK